MDSKRKSPCTGNQIPSAQKAGHNRLAVRPLGVCWLGGWKPHRLRFVVVVVRAERQIASDNDAMKALQRLQIGDTTLRGLEECFTINQLHVPRSLHCCLAIAKPATRQAVA